MSARADSGSCAATDTTPSEWLYRTQNYGVTRGILGNTPVISLTSDNVYSVRLAESDSESDGESELAALFSTPSLASTSSLGLRVHCSWCGVVMCEGDPSRPVSHGMCPTCAAKLHAELDAKAVA
jgi:hypothetical protein